MASAAGMKVVVTGLVLSCLALLPFGYAMGAARGAVPERAWGYRRFHANDSLIGLRIPCTREEKLCFTHNLLYRPHNHKCTVLALYAFAEPQEFLNGSGHLRAVHSDIMFSDVCEYYGGHRMAYDQECYNKTLVKDVLCGCNKGLSTHILGGVECRCVPPEPLRVKQPPEDGSCIVPDLRFPDIERFYRSSYDAIQGFKEQERLDYSSLDTSPLHLSCTSQHLECFSRGLVWLQGACVSLLERGPCPEEHVVALDAAAAANGHVNTTCVHVRGGCPPGHVRAAFDGSCHSQEDLRILVPGLMYRNQFGVHAFIADADRIHSLTYKLVTEVDKLLKSKEDCVINLWKIYFIQESLGEFVALPLCARDDDGDCTRLQVHVEPPLPEL